ncbi:MAG: NUDIX domain-containing protein [Candidatus Uhrbacteria bacterium]
MKKGKDYIGVGVVFVCHDGRGNILLHKRGSACRDEQGKWDFGGGSMEVGETFEEAVRREVREEYGAEPIRVELVLAQNFLRGKGEERTHWVSAVHVVLVDRESPRICEPGKMDEIGWFPLDAFPAPVHSCFATVLDAARSTLERETRV